MSYNGSGTFNINTAGQPVVTGSLISSTVFNALTADLGTGLSTAITKDGQTVTTALIPFAAGMSSTTGAFSSTLSAGAVTATSAATHTFNSSVASYAMNLNNTSGSSPNGLSVYYSSGVNSTGNPFLFCSDGASVERATIRSNGGLANFSANNVNLSDIRTKKNIELAGDYLLKICAIPVKTFLYKDQTDELLNLGVIAQDVEAVAPELIDDSGWGILPKDGTPLKAIYQTDLQFALMRCIQELKAENESLTIRIAALETK